MTEPTDSPADNPLGPDASIADDLGKLWAALGAMAGDLGATADSVAPACNGLVWCPVCRASNLLGHCSPEVVDHLSSAARSLVLAFASALKADEPAQRQGFERITLVDDPDQNGQSE